MTPNSSTINFDPAIPTDWEKSTYYVRDAQGNVMAIYEYTIDDVTQDNHYTLTERNIYGSSRLGNNNAPVEMIATTPPNPSQYSHHIGYRQYELSNHLGNVLAVISDRKIARDTDQDNTVDYYEPDVLLTYDYSPFGAPLHARSFTKEVCDEVTSTQKIEDLNTDFTDGTAQGWQALSGTTQLDASTGRLRVFKQGGGAGQLGVQQSIMATSGYVYDFTITIENAFTSNSTVVLEIIDPNNTVIYTQSVGNGNPNPIVTFTHQFTASATGTYLIKVYRTGNQSNGSFYIDDALITHEEEVTQTLCEDFAGYRYGFNGQEKDNEIKGAGNSYDFGARMLDVRLGRWMSIDPQYVKYPNLSPFASVANNPLLFIDSKGETIVPADRNSYNVLVSYVTQSLPAELARFFIKGDPPSGQIRGFEQAIASISGNGEIPNSFDDLAFGQILDDLISSGSITPEQIEVAKTLATLEISEVLTVISVSNYTTVAAVVSDPQVTNATFGNTISTTVTSADQNVGMAGILFFINNAEDMSHNAGGATTPPPPSPTRNNVIIINPINNSVGNVIGGGTTNLSTNDILSFSLGQALSRALRSGGGGNQNNTGTKGLSKADFLIGGGAFATGIQVINAFRIASKLGLPTINGVVGGETIDDSGATEAPVTPQDEGNDSTEK